MFAFNFIHIIESALDKPALAEGLLYGEGGGGGLITILTHLKKAKPITCQFYYFSPGTVHLTVQSRETQGPLLLSVQPVPGSWWSTVQYGIPEPVHSPPRVNWGNLIRNLVSGKLI